MKKIITAVVLSLGLVAPASAQYYGGASWGDWGMIPQRNQSTQFFAQPSQSGPLEIWHHPGGSELERVRLRTSIGKRQVELSGSCESACGIVILSLPKNQVCVGRSASISLHAARPADNLTGDARAWKVADEVTRSDLANLPGWARPKARAALTPPSRDWVVFSRSELLAAGYKPCAGK